MYFAGIDIKVGAEITGNPVNKLSDVYLTADEGLPVYEVVKSENGYRAIKEIPVKELKKSLSERYKRLDIAIFFNELSEVKKIYALKTPVKRSSEYSLCYAVKSGNLNIVKAVFESGELDLTSYYVQEALEVACELGLLDITKYLVKNGLNPCDRQFYPLLWARKSGNQELIEYLEKEIKKKLGELPEIKDPYEVWLEKQKQATPVIEEVKESEEKLSGRGSVVAKLPKPKKEKQKKEIKSLAELKSMSDKLLKDKLVKKVENKKVEKTKDKKKSLTLEELKAKSNKLLNKGK